MDREKYNTAERLRNQINNLSSLQRILEKNGDIYCGNHKESAFEERITMDMKKTLLKMCRGEISALEEEFEKL